MNQFLVIACITCLLPDAEIILDHQPFKFGTHEYAVTFQDAETIRADMARWNTCDRIVIFEVEELKAMIVGSKHERRI